MNGPPVVDAEDVRGLLRASPFRPFLVATRDGRFVPVRDSAAAAMSKSRLLVADVADRHIEVPFAEIIAIEPIEEDF